MHTDTPGAECRFEHQGAKILCPACGFSIPWAADRAPPRRKCQAPASRAATPPPPDTCAHRGQVIRTEHCPTCRNRTIEIPIYACALHRECALRPQKSLSVKTCAGCPDRKEPSLPPLWKRAANYSKSWLVDRATGKPRRPPELIERLYEATCAGCPLRTADSHCSACGCPVSPEFSEANKLAWANDKCPEGKWPAKRLNLIYYVLPLKNPSNVWQWHVEQLRQRMHLFDRKIITIATPGPDNRLALDSAADVIRAFHDPTIEFIERPNDPATWETPAFREMLSMVASHDPAEATFYFHAKGVRRAIQSAIRPWCEAIYRNNLDRIDEVREILSAFPCCGIAKIPQNPTNFPGGGNWHFAGTGFWFNHAALFSRPDWRTINDHSHAVEAYLSTQFDAADAYCLAYENVRSVYQAETWADPRAYSSPHAPREESRTPTVSILVTARNYGRYLRDCVNSCLAQTYPCEVIYCDDGSEDDSLDIARALPGIQVVPLVERLGAEEARNHAARHATGRALLFVDGDNMLPTHYVERMVSKLTNNTPFVYPDLQHFGDCTRYDAMPEWRDLTKGNFCDTCSLIWADAFEAVNGWKPGFAHLGDWHLFLRLSRLGTPARAGVALLYRDHGANMSQLEKQRLTAEEMRELERRVLADASGTDAVMSDE